MDAKAFSEIRIEFVVENDIKDVRDHVDILYWIQNQVAVLGVFARRIGGKIRYKVEIHDSDELRNSTEQVNEDN